MHIQHRRHHHFLALLLIRLSTRDLAIRQHIRPLAIVPIAPAQGQDRGQGNVLLAVVEEGDVGIRFRELQPRPRVVDGEVRVETRATAGPVHVEILVGDGHGVSLVVDADDSVIVGLDGEDQGGVVAVAEKVEPGVAAAVRRGVERERVVDDQAGTGDDFPAGRREGIGSGEEEEEGQRSHGAVDHLV